MQSPTTRFLRGTAATLMGCAGIAQVAALWLRELTGVAVVDAVLGAVYLIAAIGLFGHSRFSVYLGIAIPLGVSAMLSAGTEVPEAIDDLRLATNLVIALLSLSVLWLVWHHPEH